ncbi:MAG TPA: hypothetical protein PLF86_00050 [Candidatus Moranbacteria bacterium]|nr:hypothetical protein [Candidatus Moranbacteria bacterium]
MCDPLSQGVKKSLKSGGWNKNCLNVTSRNRAVLFLALILIILGSVFQFWDARPVYYAQAYDLGSQEDVHCSKSLLSVSEGKLKLFEDPSDSNPTSLPELLEQSEKNFKTEQFAKKLYEITGDAPIKEMVPFISKRDEKVAAFLIGIAKKESGWGEHVPLLNGQDCYNYWGYKGAASRGSAMGYACFSNPEEAVEIVGNRLEVLIGKNHTTASKMLIWKCGSPVMIPKELKVGYQRCLSISTKS